MKESKKQSTSWTPKMILGFYLEPSSRGTYHYEHMEREGMREILETNANKKGISNKLKNKVETVLNKIDSISK